MWLDPPSDQVAEATREAVEIIGELFAGDYVNRNGAHYRVDSAKLWDCPDGGVPIAVAVSGDQSVESFARVADAMVAVEPLPELVGRFDAMASDLYRWEYLFVNDGSPDDSLQVLQAVQRTNGRVRILDLSRNFGKEAALTAGLCERLPRSRKHANGDGEGDQQGNALHGADTWNAG